MAKVSKKRRQFEIQKRKNRRRKVQKLREKFLSTTLRRDKEQILQKIRKIAPHYSVDQILASEA
ncbi:MAG TPA: DUF6800 family protein [Nitrospiria bacterium]|nr:DUF6800 family protein [Nitrospiria bacterium]